MRLVLAWVVCIYLCYVCLGDATTVSTPVGNINGMTEVVNTDDGPVIVTKFLGIPYAESTAGENRFKKPIPKQPFTDTFDATRVPLGCIQTTPEATRRFSQVTNFSEDCLTLNIYVPHDFSQNTPLSVMIWIHGGAFVSDTAAAYNVEVLSTFGNVIVVTLNYRLGMFGFLRSGDGSLIGNQGLWDQHLAIKWVHDNIEAFGGDANDVTLFGGKAGGVCATFQALYPGNKGYFRRVIAQSGSALAYWGNLEKPNAEDYMKVVGCQNRPKPIDCLYAKGPEELQLETYLIVGEPVFRPGVDNDFLVEEPYQIIFGNNPKSASAREFFASLDLTIVVTNFDGGVFLLTIWPSILNYTDFNDFTMTRELFTESAIPKTVEDVIKPVDYNSGEVFKQLLDFIYTDWSKPNDSAALLLSLTEMSSDVAFFYPGVSIANGHSLLRSGKTYFSVFSVDPTNHAIPTPSWITGANHEDEAQFVFGYPLSDNSDDYTSTDKNVSRTMLTLWTNFAMFGNPNGPSDNNVSIWPEYTSETQGYLEVLNEELKPGTRYRARRMQAWLELIPNIKTLSGPRCCRTPRHPTYKSPA